MANGGDDGSLFSHVLAGTIFLVGQCIAGVIWLTTLGARVSTIEKEREAERQERIAERIRYDGEIKRLDTDGTRALGVVANEVQEIRRRINTLEK